MDPKKKSRRKFLKDSAAVAGLAVGTMGPAGALAAATEPPSGKSVEELVAYGERSRFVTSTRMAVAERPSPDAFGMLFHVLSPLQDSVGSITPSSLHFIGTHRGAIVPDIDPKKYRLLIHGMVDRPLEFTLDDLKRLPSVSRPHFIECLGNRARPTHKTVQETHGLTSCSEWTGVPLSLLLKECGVQKGASWVVSEGSEEVHGSGSIRMAKAIDDVMVAYGQNGESIRPQNGFPVRLIVPGFEGVYNVKWLRRIKAVDRYYMTYNDYGHIQKDPKVAELVFEWGPKSVITFPSGGQKLPGPGVYQVTGLARGPQGGGIRRRRKNLERGADSRNRTPDGAHALWHGMEVGRSGMRAAVALHGRTGAGAAGAGAVGQVPGSSARPLQDTQRTGHRQYDYALEGG